MEAEVDMTEPLNLKLSDEEIAKHVTEVIDGSGPLPSAEEMARGVADGATAKATWGIQEWLKEFIDLDAHRQTWEYCVDFLEAQGIQKPSV